MRADLVLAANLIFGALLAMFGGMVTHLVTQWLAKRDAKTILVSALTAELFCARESMSADLAGFRDSLRKGDPATPTAFSYSTTIYQSYAAQLGQLRDYALIEHIVDVYSSLHDINRDCARYVGVPNSDISLSEFNAIHMDATITHMKVIKLHTKLAKSGHAPPMLLDVENDSKQLFQDYHTKLEAGQIDKILGHQWSDA